LETNDIEFVAVASTCELIDLAVAVGITVYVKDNYIKIILNKPRKIVIDGVYIQNHSKILLKDQIFLRENGIYTTNWVDDVTLVLKRTSDRNNGSLVFVQNGHMNAQTQWQNDGNKYVPYPGSNTIMTTPAQ